MTPLQTFAPAVSAAGLPPDVSTPSGHFISALVVVHQYVFIVYSYPGKEGGGQLYS